MVQNDLRIFGKYYDQIYLKKKNYQREAESIKKIINQFEKKHSKTLLDVGCGTGEHLKYLSQNFRCEGIDINKVMIETAKTKVSNAEFKIANMIDFMLKDKFDVITCLFGSIGYVQNFENLVRTFRNFHNYLNNNGLTIVEPWIFKKDFQKGNPIAIDTYKNHKIKLTRMAVSNLTKSQWLIYMHYLIGKDGDIRYVKEIHKMLASDYEDYVKAINLAGYSKTIFLKENLWRRGLFVTIK